MQVTVLMPCLNDAATVSELVEEIADHLQRRGMTPSFLVVDDGSQPPLASLLAATHTGGPAGPSSRQPIEVLELKRNMGHQRALACGLCHLAGLPERPEVVVVLDSDGEDRPGDIPLLVDALGSVDGASHRVAFAERTRRTEGLVFWLGYMSYLSLHRLLVGHAPRIGNFSALSGALLEGLTTDPDLWSHFAACIWKSRIKKVLVPLPRGCRRRGSSHLGLGGLVLHGLSAISCYRETLALRLLLGCGIMLLAALLAFGAALAAPTWEQAVVAAGIVLGVMLSLSLLAFGQCFLVMQSRHQSTVIPIADYRHYVRKVVMIPAADNSVASATTSAAL